MKYINKKLFLLAFLALSSYGSAQDYAVEDCCPTYCNDCGDWFITADFIYWKTHGNNLDFAQDATIGGGTFGNSHDLDWRWDPGFKVGVGYAFENCGWDAYLNYTWFYTHASGSAGPGVFPMFISNITPNLLYLNIASDWHLHYQTLDLEVGNWFFLSSSFAFRPNFGVRGAWTRDRDTITNITAVLVNTFEYRQKVDGVGPRVGLNAHWSFWDSFSIFADGSATLLWGNYEVQAIVTNPVLALGSINTEHDFSTIKALTDFKIGLGWDTFFCNDYHFSLQLAWEQRYWFCHNEYQRFRFAESCYRNNDGDLALYGVTLTACLKF